MHKHFVRFLSPGTFVAEETVKEIPSWDVDKAVEMAREVSERYGARPYGFQFQTRGREDDELDSYVIDESGFYFLGGEVLSIEDVRARGLEDERTLLRNMECNGYERVVVNTNSWRWVQPLLDRDEVLDVTI